MLCNGQSAAIKELIALDCCDSLMQGGGYFCQMITSSFDSAGCGTHIYLKFNLQSINLVYKGVDFYLQNVLKLTYERL